jgi:hypothetical protein
MSINLLATNYAPMSNIQYIIGLFILICMAIFFIKK